MSASHQLNELEQRGCFLAQRVLSPVQVSQWIGRLAAIHQSESSSVLRSNGETYGARNLLSLVPAVVELAAFPAIREIAQSVLGDKCAVVRGLYFDKPPNRTWTLPWHRDRTIAVKSHCSDCREFSNPNTKAGVPHYIAPPWLLERMLTFRFHLDPMTAENGPLVVLEGSHLSVPATDEDLADASSQTIRTIHCGAGDCFVMRPLLAHCSLNSHEGTQLHRRVIHLECASADALPAALQWHDCHRFLVKLS